MGARSGEELEPGGARRAGAAGKAGLVTRDEGWGGGRRIGNPEEDGEAGTAARCGGDWPAPPGPHLGPRCGRAASRLHTARRGGNGWNSSRGSGSGAGGAGRGGEGARGTGDPRRRCGALSRAARALRHARRRGPPFLAAHPQPLPASGISRRLLGAAQPPGPPNLGSGSGPLDPPPAEPSSVPADQAFRLGDCAQHPTRRTQRLRVVRPRLVPAYAFGKPWPLRSSVVLGLAFVAGQQTLLYYRR